MVLNGCDTKGGTHMLRKCMLILSGMLLLTLIFSVSALAETYSFGDVRASVTIPDNFEQVLTPYNLGSNRDWLEQHGLDHDSLSNSFDQEGVLLMAYEEKEGRTLVITALRDVDGQTYFDLNNQDESMRKEFRTSHTNGTAYGLLGYAYTSAKWANYGKNAMRFLQTEYTLRQEGELVCAGYQRRTIRNGYTITLDMQIRGRSPKQADNALLEKVMKTWEFTEVLPMPALPIKLSLTSAPPTETSEAAFTIKGTTVKKAKVTATLFSLGTTGGQTFTDTANNSGNFAIKVTLPSQGVYSLTLTAEQEGAISAQRLYSVTFRQGMLPVDLVVTPGDSLDDETIVSGTTEAGAKTQLSVSGPVPYNKIVSGDKFSFKVDTHAEGTYQFVLVVTKKGMHDRTFSFTGTRSYTDSERGEKLRANARKMAYANLAKTENQGKSIWVEGYITGVTQSINEWVVTVALTKSGSSYKDVCYVICQEKPSYPMEIKVKIYGTAAGTYTVLSEDGNVKSYPRIEAVIIDPAT